MGRFWRKMSLAGQWMALLSVCLVVTAVAALGVVAKWESRAGHAFEAAAVLRLEMIGALSLAALASIALVMVALRGLLVSPLSRVRDWLSEVATARMQMAPRRDMPNRDLEQIRLEFDQMIERLQAARASYEEAQRILNTRTGTVDRLLDFSQTIHGAGQSSQIFTALCHYLKNELSLAGIVIVSHEPQQTPEIRLRAALPAEAIVPGAQLSNLQAGDCPCLRQHLPKVFKLGAAPVRCAIDSCLALGPEHPAYCVPFAVGRAMQVVVHMLLPVGECWNEDRKQLAQTYVNTAVSSLTSLHLLEEAEKQSMTDVLTGLFNRRSMESLLQREVALAERHNHALSLVMIDLDHFKEINDAHGHAAGDHMLKSFADCVRITLRKTDLAFRYGGDEFVIALPQTTIPQAVQVVHKLRQAFSAVDFSHAIANLDHSPTLSIGVVERSVPQNIITLQNLLTAADQALYDAKAANRNCVKVYQPPKAA